MQLEEIKSISEMAHHAGNVGKHADEYAVKCEMALKDAKHIGDIEKFQVRSDGHFFSVWDNNRMISMVKVDKTKSDYVTVDALWTKDEFRGQKVMAMLLWFLKSRENYQKMLIGIHHSDDTYEILKSGGLSKFKRYWYDPASGKSEDFDKNTVDLYYANVDSSKDGWSLMLENGFDSLTSMPRFNTMSAGFVTQAYDWQIE